MKKIYLCDYILPMSNQSLIEKGFITTYNDLIFEIGQQSELAENLKNDQNLKVIALRDSFIMPGFINNHLHLAYPQNFSEIESDEQIEWIDELVDQSRNFQREQKLQIAKSNLKSVLRSGTTHIIENTPFEETIEVLQESPLKALIGLEVFGTDPQKTQNIFASARQKLNEYEKKYNHPNLQFTLSPHSIYNVSADLLIELSNWSEQNNKFLPIHLAEFAFESELTEDGEANEKLKNFHQKIQFHPPMLNSLKNLTPVEYLKEIDCLKPNLLATHLVRADREDLEILSNKNIPVISCARSNAYLLNGRAKIEIMQELGLSVSFATDGLSSNFDLDLLNEIKAAQLIHKSHGYCLSEKQLLQGITYLAAHQIGKEKEIGSLEKGKKADFIYFELTPDQKPNIENIYSFIVKNLNSSQIRQVWINAQEAL